MKQLDYFPFYYSYIERFSDLSDAELGRAVRAACGHGMGEEVSVTERVVSLALKTMNFDLDRAKANYAEQIERKRESGRRGAAKRWGLDPAEEAAAASARVETASAVSGAEAAVSTISAAEAAISTAFAEVEAASEASAAEEAAFPAFGGEEAALTTIAAEEDSGIDTLFSDGSAMVSNGKHGKSNSDSKSKSKSNSESKSKSESKSESESKSKSKSKSKSESESKGKSESKSDFFTPLPGGVGGEIRTAEDFLSLAGDDRVLRERMREYLSLLTRKRKQLTPAALRAVGRKLSSYPRDQWLEVLDQSLRNGWSDLYDLPAAGRMNPRPGGDCQAHGAPIGSLAQRAVLSMLSGETRLR